MTCSGTPTLGRWHPSVGGLSGRYGMRGTNLVVFRDNASQITGRKLGERLIDAVDKTARGNDREAMLNALLLAGQAECAIADSESADDTARLLTDALAMALIGDLEEARADLSDLLRK